MKKVILSFWIEPERKKALKKMAIKQKITIGELIRRVIDNFIIKFN